MRAYLYENGTWQLCKDWLPAEPELSAFSDSYQRSTLYGKAWEEYNTLFHQGLGFPSDYETRESRMGTVKVYARPHHELSEEREKDDIPDFLCVLRFSGVYIRVWIPDLPSLHLFLHDIDAQKEQTSLVDYLNGFTGDSDLGNVAMWLSYVLQDFHAGNSEITVKPPKPPKRINRG